MESHVLAIPAITRWQDVYVVHDFPIYNHFQKRFYFFLFIVPAPEIVCINLFF